MKIKVVIIAMFMATFAWSYPSICNSYKQMSKRQIKTIAKEQKPIATSCYLAYQHYQNVISAQQEQNALLEAIAYIELWHTYKILDKYSVNVKKEQNIIMRKLRELSSNRVVAIRIDDNGVLHQYMIDFKQMELVDTLLKQQSTNNCIDIYDKSFSYLGCVDKNKLDSLLIKGGSR